MPSPQVQAARWAKSPYVWQACTPHSRTGTLQHRHPGSREFFTNLAREVPAAAWWCPSAGEARAYLASDPWSERAGARG